MKNDGWLSISWPISRLFSKFHPLGAENKIRRGIDQETGTRAGISIKKPLRKGVRVARCCKFIHRTEFWNTMTNEITHNDTFTKPHLLFFSFLGFKGRHTGVKFPLHHPCLSVRGAGTCLPIPCPPPHPLVPLQPVNLLTRHHTALVTSSGPS